MNKLLTLVAAGMMMSPAKADTLSDAIRADMPQLMDLYRDMHANPELSMQEVRTPAKLAPMMRKLGFDVTEHVGHVLRPSGWSARLLRYAQRQGRDDEAVGCEVVSQRGDVFLVPARPMRDHDAVVESFGFGWLRRTVKIEGKRRVVRQERDDGRRLRHRR